MTQTMKKTGVRAGHSGGRRKAAEADETRRARPGRPAASEKDERRDLGEAADSREKPRKKRVASGGGEIAAKKKAGTAAKKTSSRSKADAEKKRPAASGRDAATEKKMSGSGRDAAAHRERRTEAGKAGRNQTAAATEKAKETGPARESADRRTKAAESGRKASDKRTKAAESGRKASDKQTKAEREGSKAAAPRREKGSGKASRPSSKSRSTASKPGKKASGRHLKGNATAEAAKVRRHGSRDDLFMEQVPKKARASGAGEGKPPKGRSALFGAINLGLVIAILTLVALGARVQKQYDTFLGMREVVDQQTFYEGTTVEGVDVSRMTLPNAIDYWRDRVETRYANRAAVLDNGATVTALELGYSSDYESVLQTAWSAGRSGSLEDRYRMAASRRQNPVAYTIHRTDYDEARVDQYVQTVAVQVDQPAVDADVEDFNTETYEFTFKPSQPGRELDTEALKRSIEEAIAAGGGNVSLQIAEIPPQVSTGEVEGQYGLIDYAITNANSSSRARLNNIKLAMSLINGCRVAPGETFSFNETVGQRTVARGFRKATAYSGGDVTEEVGGGICQVSTTLFNAAVKADMDIVERHNHSLTVSYVDKGKDATVDWGHQDFRFTNTSEDDIFICCYLTEDNRIRFGIFGRLLPNGEKITLDGVTTEVVKYETEYQPSAFLPKGQTSVLQPGRNGYKAEAYKVRWDAQGNRISRELLCKSVYKSKNEIIQYGT